MVIVLFIATPPPIVMRYVTIPLALGNRNVGVVADARGGAALTEAGLDAKNATAKIAMARTVNRGQLNLIFLLFVRLSRSIEYSMPMENRPLNLF